jgi:hypothetical protein
LLFSLAVGLFVSVLSRNPFRATSAALLLVLLAGFGLPLLSEYFDHYLKWPGVAGFTAWISPFYAQTHACAAVSWLNPRAFWSSVLVVGLMSLTLLLLTCGTVTRALRDGPENTGGLRWRSWLGAFRTWNFGRGRARQSLREQLLRRNPIAWLAGRERVSSPGLLFLATLICCASDWALRMIAPASNMEDQLVVWIWAAIQLHIFLLAKVGSAACERLGSDRQSGALELLLCTPLSVSTILRGQWQALRRQLAGAVLIAWLIHGVVLFHACAMFFLSGSKPVRLGELLVVSFRNLWARFPVAPWEESFAVLCILGAALVLAAHWITLGWVGMWMGLRAAPAPVRPLGGLGPGAGAAVDSLCAGPDRHAGF